MTRFFEWLFTRFRPEKRAPQPVLRRTGVHRVATTPKRKKPPVAKAPVEYSSEVSGKIVDGGPGKNVLIRNKYVREDSGTHDTLKIVDDSLLDSDEEIGLDPYNTGRFDRSKTWDTSRFRK